ncbi:MAG: redoxin domain-containing protein [Acidobacteriota bacterium]
MLAPSRLVLLLSFLIGSTAAHASSPVLGLKLSPELVIEALAPGSTAEQAGLKEGDRLTLLDEQVIETASELESRLATLQAGSAVTLVVERKGQLVDAALVPESRTAFEKRLLAPPPRSRVAPKLDVDRWFGDGPASLSELEGKVVVLEFFQLWCPGCNRFSHPLMKRWHRELSKRDDVAFLSVHTVFEGHSAQTPDRLADWIEQNRTSWPVGVDRQEPDQRLPETMRTWRTRGTPEMAFIDRRGFVRFQQFGSFDSQRARAFLDELLKEEAVDVEGWS